MKSCIKITADAAAEMAAKKLESIERWRIWDRENFISQLMEEDRNSFWRWLWRREPLSRDEVVARYENESSHEPWFSELQRIDWSAQEQTRLPQSILSAAKTAKELGTCIYLSIDDFVALKS